MEQDPTTGYIYYYQWQASGDQFAYWDPATGTNTVVRTYTPSPQIYTKRLAFAPDGTLYMMDTHDRLFTINKTNGDITSLGQVVGLETGAYGGTGDFAFSPGGMLYLVTYQSLYTLNLQTRVATRLYSNMIGQQSLMMWTGLAYCDGMLFASDIEEVTGLSAIYKINPNTGQTVELFYIQNILNDLTSCSALAQPNNQAKQGNVAGKAALEYPENGIAALDNLVLPNNGSNAITGIGVMGDSNSDEYRADDNRGGAYAATTLNWVEQLSRSRGLNFGRWGNWGDPRRTGFEYNWALSGATAQSLIDSGQHTGLAQQVADGQVSYVILYIGTNDFHLVNGTYEEIYNGTLTGVALQSKINAIVQNMTLAVDTILAAGQVKMVVINIGDPGKNPAAFLQFPDPQRRQRVTDAIDATNFLIGQMGQARGIPVADLAAFTNSILSKVNLNGDLEMGDEFIHLMERGDEPHHMQLDDFSGHPGTVASGLLANWLLVDPFNQNFSTGIDPLSDQEISINAGIKIQTSNLLPRVYLPILIFQ